MRIHREGHRFLLWLGMGLLLVLSVLWLWSGFPGGVLWLLSGLGGVVFVFFLQFFRYPRLVFHAESGVVYAPAEGRIVTIKETTEEECFPGGRCRQLSIFMSPFNVHVNRAPMSGRVVYYRYHAGRYLVAYHPKSSTLNERTTLLLKDKTTDQPVVLRQIAGLVARRICCYTKEGNTLKAGEAFGFIKFGSRVDVFLPLSAELLIAVGAYTSCGSTPLARLVPPTNA